MIAEIIKSLQNNNHFGAGNYTEIAKGKYEIALTWSDAKRKIKRLWLSRKQ